MVKLDYYVQDEYGDIWNVEAFSSYGQAFQFLSSIKSLLTRTLKITHFERPQIDANVSRAVDYRRKERVDRFISSEF